jgi:hypothetical protein
MSEIVLPLRCDKELAKWMEDNEADPDIMVQTFFRIKDKNGQFVKFKYNRPQFTHKERSSDFDFVLKARKMGISSRRIARDLAICATRKGQHRILLTHTGDSADKMMAERVKPFLQNCAYPLNATSRQDYIYFPATESRYYIGTAGAKKFGRADDITGKHYSEYAHWPSPEVATGVDEALIEGADGLIETTANGHNFAKKHWEDSKRGRNKDKAIFLPWYVCDDYSRDPGLETGPLSEEEQQIMAAFKLNAANVAWRRWKKRTMVDPSLFPQEYPETDEEAFISSGRPVFDKVALAYCRQTCSEPKFRGYLLRQQSEIKFVPQAEGSLRIWKMPEREHVYAIGSDVAEGLKDGAYSTGEVLDIGDGEQVAEWHGHISPDQLADILALLSSFYNGAFVIPESWPGPGEVTTSALLRERVKVWTQTTGDKPGFHTTAHTKTPMIAALNAALRDYSLTIRSPDLLEELHAYIYSEPKSNRYQNLVMEPSIGNFSDRLMAMGIAWFCTRDMADRVDYYASKRVSELFRPKIGVTRVSAPQFTGPRFGVNAK